MAETPLEAQKRIEARKTYEQLTARINALDTDIGRELDSQRRYTVQQLRDELAAKREAVATELSALGWGAGDTPQPAPPTGSDNSYYRGLMADEAIRQNDKQLERLDGRLAMLSDEVARIRQDLAVTKVTTDGIRNDLKEKIDALSAELYRMRGDLAVTKEAVLAVQNELRSLTDKLSAPPRGLSTNGLITLLVSGSLIIVILVIMTMYLLLRPI